MFQRANGLGDSEGLGMELVSRWQRGASLCNRFDRLAFCLFSSQVITFPARWSRRGRGGRVVTFCRKFTATSPGFTPNPRRTALSQVGRDTTAPERSGVAVLEAVCKRVKGADVSDAVVAFDRSWVVGSETLVPPKLRRDFCVAPCW